MFFNLLPSTSITTGYKKSCLTDMENSIFYQVPNSMAKLFLANTSFYIEDFLSSFTKDDRDIIKEYICFFEKNKLGLITKYQINFINQKKQDNYQTPFFCSNLILDSVNEDDLLKKIIRIKKYSSSIGVCQLRMFYIPSYEFLELLISTAIKYNFINIELLFNYNKNIAVEKYENLLVKYSKIVSRIVIMGSPNNTSRKEEKIAFTQEELLDSNQCGIIHKNLFMTDIESHMLSSCYNSCLYRKISIDKNGFVKQCPSMKKSFGHIDNCSIDDIICSKEFQKLWYIKKEEIDVCQDCEFRHICTDCRAFIKDPNNTYSQPEKCGYNPYIALWKGQKDWINVEQWRKKNPTWEVQAKENRKDNQF